MATPSLLHHLVHGPVPSGAEPSSLLEARARAMSAAAPFADSIDRAAAAGFAADRLGYAFAGGYHAALLRLVPSLSPDDPVCLCATEEGGAHPRAIATQLAPREGGGYTVTGKKTWSTLAERGATLLVVASLGDDGTGRNRLKVVRVPASREGVTVRTRPPAPFAPEIPHAEIELAGVALTDDEVLSGDGYVRYLKPFRTIEDAHVLAATLGYLASVARRADGGHALIEGVCADVAALRAIAAADPTDKGVHVALAGVFASVRRRLAENDGVWSKVAPEERARWERDRLLLEVAEKARGKRLEAAWKPAEET